MMMMMMAIPDDRIMIAIPALRRGGPALEAVRDP